MKRLSVVDDVRFGGSDYSCIAGCDTGETVDGSGVLFRHQSAGRNFLADITIMKPAGECARGANSQTTENILFERCLS